MSFKLAKIYFWKNSQISVLKLKSPAYCILQENNFDKEIIFLFQFNSKNLFKLTSSKNCK